MVRQRGLAQTQFMRENAKQVKNYIPFGECGREGRQQGGKRMGRTATVAGAAASHCEQCTLRVCTCPRRGTSLPGCPHPGLLPRLPPPLPARQPQVLSLLPLHLRARTWVRAACQPRPLPSLRAAWRLSSPCPPAATEYDRCWMLLLGKAVCAAAVAGLCGMCSAIATQPPGGMRQKLRASPAGCHRQRWGTGQTPGGGGGGGGGIGEQCRGNSLPGVT